MEVYKGFLKVNGSELYFELAGKGTPIVLIHGSNLDCRMWDFHFNRLSNKYRVVRFDMRGLGRTLASIEPFSNYDDILSLLDYLGIAKAWFVGHSFGGSTAIEFALKYSDRAFGLLVSGTGLMGSTPSEQTMEFRTQLNESAKAGNLEGSVALTLQAYVDGWTQKPGRANETVRMLVAELTRYAYQLPRSTSPIWPTFLTPNAREQIQSLRVPIKVLVGEFDFPEYHEIATYIAEKVKSAEIQIIPNTAHSLCMEIPDLFCDAIDSFIENSSTEIMEKEHVSD